MTLQDLLNTDVSALGGWVRQGYAWWIDELTQILPDSWRRNGRSDRPIAELGPEDAPVRVWRHGRFTEVIEHAAPRRQAADLGLPSGLVLVRRLTLPAVGLADLKRLVALELDRLTPFRPDQVYFDIELLERDRETGRQALVLGVILREDAEAALERARRLGITPLRLGVIEDGALKFDFLQPLRAAGRGGRSDNRQLLWWLGAATLIALNVGILVLKDMGDVADLRRAVDLQRPTVALALKLRQRVEGEAGARKALLDRRAHNEPLRIEDAVTRAFPAPQWVQRLEWNGRAVRIVGFRDPNFDVLAAIHGSPALGAPRELNASAAPAPGAKPAFDVIAEPGAAPPPNGGVRR